MSAKHDGRICRLNQTLSASVGCQTDSRDWEFGSYQFYPKNPSKPPIIFPTTSKYKPPQPLKSILKEEPKIRINIQLSSGIRRVFWESPRSKKSPC